METCLVNLRWKPWEADHEDLVYIGRYNRWAKLPQSKWHNPFKIPKGQDTPAKRREILEDYRAYLLGREDLVLALPELRGKILCCRSSGSPSASASSCCCPTSGGAAG